MESECRAEADEGMEREAAFEPMAEHLAEVDRQMSEQRGIVKARQSPRAQERIEIEAKSGGI